MKRTLFFFLYLLLSINAFTQLTSAKIKRVNGIILNKYSLNASGSYYEDGTFLIYNGDTIRFIQNSIANIDFLKKYPDLISVLGDYTDYENDYLLELSNGIYKHDLSISNYNFHTEELGNKIVKSVSFFTKDGCDDLYIIYCFTGLVVFYSGLTDFKPESHESSYPQINIKNIAVLKETIDLKPLKDTQIVEMRLKKSGIRSIQVFYCE